MITITSERWGEILVIRMVPYIKNEENALEKH